MNYNIPYPPFVYETNEESFIILLLVKVNGGRCIFIMEGNAWAIYMKARYVVIETVP